MAKGNLTICSDAWETGLDHFDIQILQDMVNDLGLVIIVDVPQPKPTEYGIPNDGLATTHRPDYLGIDRSEFIQSEDPGDEDDGYGPGI